MTIFDTSGIEAFIAENDFKYSNKIVKQLKVYKKFAKLDDSYAPYKTVHGSMPSCNKDIKQLYINGHFCYIYKFSLITNGLGTVRDLHFYNKDFPQSHSI